MSIVYTVLFHVLDSMAMDKMFVLMIMIIIMLMAVVVVKLMSMSMLMSCLCLCPYSWQLSQLILTVRTLLFSRILPASLNIHQLKNSR